MHGLDWHRYRNSRLTLLALGVALIALLGTGSSALAQRSTDTENQRCLECHGQLHILNLKPEDRRLMVRGGDGDLSEEPPMRPGLYIDYDRIYRSSVHANIACTACHPDCHDLPHAARAAPPRCDQCHPAEQQEYTSSVHGHGSANAATCSDCHGAHDMLSSINPQSRTHKRQLPFTCAGCHSNTVLMEQEGVHQPLASLHYLDSLHGHALIIQGLLAAPSCNDCHGVHDIRPSEDPMSKVNRSHIPETCGTLSHGFRRGLPAECPRATS